MIPSIKWLKLSKFLTGIDQHSDEPHALFSWCIHLLHPVNNESGCFRILLNTHPLLLISCVLHFTRFFPERLLKRGLSLNKSSRSYTQVPLSVKANMNYMHAREDGLQTLIFNNQKSESCILASCAPVASNGHYAIDFKGTDGFQVRSIILSLFLTYFYLS